MREILASLGYKSINEIIGKTDLLSQINKGASNLDDLDLNPLLVQADPGENARYCKEKIINEVPDTLDEEIWPEIKNRIDITKKNFSNTRLRIHIDRQELDYHIIFIKNLEMEN